MKKLIQLLLLPFLSLFLQQANAGGWIFPSGFMCSTYGNTQQGNWVELMGCPAGQTGSRSGRTYFSTHKNIEGSPYSWLNDCYTVMDYNTCQVALPPPSAEKKTINTVEDVAGSVTLTATGADADKATFAIARDSEFGTATISGSNFTFVPNPNWSGTTILTYRATTKHGTSIAASITVNVAAVDDAPTAVGKLVFKTLEGITTQVRAKVSVE